jgi:hypothetical protein
VADADDVQLGHRGRGDPDAIDERPVVAAHVHDLVLPAGHRAQLGVAAGHGEVIDHDVAVRSPADQHRLAGRQRDDRGGSRGPAAWPLALGRVVGEHLAQHRR